MGGLTRLSVIPESRPIQFGHLRDNIRVALSGVHAALACGGFHESLLHPIMGLENPADLLGVSQLHDDASFMLAGS
jgi:hypothetical protein